ncbi:Protein-tyrosine-phosphatase [Lentibacillus sp. JNUCC-1]|uniref:CpsB/CapC family capsule biosynthesis tyrosine phosphatase n=1 Tax=Lentibacillus sp. JNUCC-1 TaxID=2654513 RepID=UPI0012E96E84|nr:CpsB/CapC family capsule biosynthesis tyrosine phosphatase [Lentibacillus sp. JNUCC-1]MUV37185.1 Protein-tyrosine-phosphatase [Lentibacillus sp. JNUCC-1]
MIDLHRHILPGFADGQPAMAASLKIASEASKQGITSIIAAPHHPIDSESGYNAILDSVRDMNEQLKASQIPVEILPGQGTRIHGI